MPAFLLNPLIKYGLIALVMAGLLAGLVWFKHEAKVARESQAVAERQAAISAADAARWQAAAADRDAALADQQATIARQNAQIEAARADDAKQAAAALASAEARRRERDAFDARIRDLQEEAHAHPDQIVPVGPIVRRRAPGLFDEPTSRPDPQAVPAS